MTMSEIYDIREELERLQLFLKSGCIKQHERIVAGAFSAMIADRIQKLTNEIDEYDSYVDKLERSMGY